MANLNPPVSFTELFQAMPDVYNGVYQAYLAEYGNFQRTEEEMQKLSTVDFPADQVPAVFIFQDNHRNIRAVHHMHKITRPLGQPPGQWDNVCIGFSSDIHEGHITTLVLPTPELFTATPNTIVPTTATMQQRLTTAANGMLQQFDINDADVEEVRSRRVIPVPHAYVMQFLYRSLTPSDAWQQIGMQIIADGREADCMVLLNFLRMTAVNERAQLRNDPDLLPRVAIVEDVAPPHGDGVFFAHLTRKLRTLLPAGTMAPTPNAVLQQVMHGQNMLRQTLQEAAIDNRAARLHEQEVAAAPKTVSEVFPAHAAKIRALCDAGNDDDLLPELWKQLARAGGKKTAGFNLFQELATARACDPTSARVHPIVSATLYEQISKFRIGTSDQEDLKIGLSPFLMCPTGYLIEYVIRRRRWMVLQLDGSVVTDRIRQWTTFTSPNSVSVGCERRHD